MNAKTQKIQLPTTENLTKKLPNQQNKKKTKKKAIKKEKGVPQSLFLDFLFLGWRGYQAVPSDLSGSSKTRETGILSCPTKSSLKYLSSSKTETNSSSWRSSTLNLNSSPQPGFKLFFTTLVFDFCFPSCNLTYGSLSPFESVGGRFRASITRTKSFIFFLVLSVTMIDWRTIKTKQYNMEFSFCALKKIKMYITLEQIQNCLNTMQMGLLGIIFEDQKRSKTQFLFLGYLFHKIYLIMTLQKSVIWSLRKEKIYI